MNLCYIKQRHCIWTLSNQIGEGTLTSIFSFFYEQVEVTMEKLNNVIERYLHEWLECSKCNEMVTVNSIRATNEDEPICVICNEEESTH